MSLWNIPDFCQVYKCETKGATEKHAKEKRRGKPRRFYSLEISQIIPSRTAPKNANTAQIARALKLRAVSKVCLPYG